MSKDILIVAAKRTPIGSFQGDLRYFSASQLGSIVIEAALRDVKRAQPIDTTLEHNSEMEYEHIAQLIDEVFMGCVLTAGVGQAPARQAALMAKIPVSVSCTTINKVCGSGLKSILLACDMIKAGAIRTAVAGGMESMTNAPYLLTDSRHGMRIGHKAVLDHLYLDGLQDAFDGHLMGVYGQQTASKYDISRETMDEWAIRSINKAREADNSQAFHAEIVPITAQSKKALVTVEKDQHPNAVNPKKIPNLPPLFSQHGEQGTITAASSSAIGDGAAALVLMEAEQVRRQGLYPLASIKGYASHSRDPDEFTIAPIHAIKQLLDDLNWSTDDVDLWEINEAFAAVTIVAIEQLGIDAEKVNVNGGACALGHPIGATGSRVVVTLTHALRQKVQMLSSTKTKTLKGVAAVCVGGGEALAIAIEVDVK
ncbi:thiolase family protein [Photobacterium angustum]|uniref:Acetyl-CoA C-acyltransferase n=1 Tax=Photobacterium angustum TaxID=661 RepID=A0A855SFA3_PHOAN|nr:thiolase family protein [Photobacterium angustum]KJF83357.1 acetyl-CoA acetyltransferase [Photobacterium damselae subsp. damselae]KJG17893.1 acetyl-CoA acetyltransferase [Photobacterium angustum]KJG24552.1 acetyl-CoA acetyltransferase [Photobacterium angustum]KJG32760.1 acetyl-CoA acetyltransferase [Photobacterium angustum]KJG42790.1 acetyl-CoA acetyltransferase [Photobacterium angustum]